MKFVKTFEDGSALHVIPSSRDQTISLSFEEYQNGRLVSAVDQVNSPKDSDVTIARQALVTKLQTMGFVVPPKAVNNAVRVVMRYQPAQPVADGTDIDQLVTNALTENEFQRAATEKVRPKLSSPHFDAIERILTQAVAQHPDEGINAGNLHEVTTAIGEQAAECSFRSQILLLLHRRTANGGTINQHNVQALTNDIYNHYFAPFGPDR